MHLIWTVAMKIHDDFRLCWKTAKGQGPLSGMPKATSRFKLARWIDETLKLDRRRAAGRYFFIVPASSRALDGSLSVLFVSRCISAPDLVWPASGFFLIRPRAGTVTATIAPTMALAGKFPWHIIRNPSRPPPGPDRR